ncbi:MAG TPA: VWA domain-containing protein, partial [Vicinamibacterales bacterium]|nr:VWA domain-containing protein [Vicinamibacterales bacterium]
MTGPSRVSSALLAFSLLALATPSAESAADRGAQQPPIRTEATFVRVDVYPTKDGRPVPGLTKKDFEVFEDGVLQTVQTFEHIQIRSAGATLDVAEPASQREMLQEAANPRNRIFVIFLDVPHVSLAGSHTIIEPLIRLMNKMLGPDDLVGVMTPAMSVRDLVLGRRALVLEETLRRNWDWGQSDDRTLRLSEREHMYAVCYPSRTSADLSALAKQMISKSRERMTLEALQDLVVYLHAIKEERKAIVAVSQGWRLYGETPEMMNIRDADPIPGREPITVDPTGTLTLGDKRNTNVSRTECDADRMRLATMDNERFFRDVLADANRSNASFYPIDPRGLSVSPAGVDTLRELADNTDGLAILNTNDLDTGLQRIVDDLTSYYLLGYSSTNPKLDGRYRSLRVRVKQPGINVRARRGYRAPRPEEVTIAPAPPGTPGDGESSAALTRALGALARITPASRLFVHAVLAEGTAPETGELWIAGELPRAPGPDAWAQGGQADVQVSGGNATGGAKVSFQRGQRAF